MIFFKIEIQKTEKKNILNNILVRKIKGMSIFQGIKIYSHVDQIIDYEDSYNLFHKVYHDIRFMSKNILFCAKNLEFKICNNEKSTQAFVTCEMIFSFQKVIHYKISFENINISISFCEKYDNLFELIWENDKDLDKLFINVKGSKISYNKFDWFVFFNKLIEIYGDLQWEMYENYFDEKNNFHFCRSRCIYDKKTDTFSLFNKRDNKIYGQKREYIIIKIRDLKNAKIFIHLLKQLLR